MASSYYKYTSIVLALILILVGALSFVDDESEPDGLNEASLVAEQLPEDEVVPNQIRTLIAQGIDVGAEGVRVEGYDTPLTDTVKLVATVDAYKDLFIGLTVEDAEAQANKDGLGFILSVVDGEGQIRRDIGTGYPFNVYAEANDGTILQIQTIR